MTTRVLHVINHFAHGGIESTLFGILRSYDRESFQHDVCCIGGEEGYLAAEARRLGSDILLCRKSVDLTRFAGRFAELIDGRGYDIVHSHVNSWSGALMLGAERAGVRVRIAHLHSASKTLAGRALGWNLTGVVGYAAARYVDWRGLLLISQHATHVLGVSQTALDLHWPRWREDPRRFMLWAGGVDTAVFKPRSDRPADDAARLIFVGSFNADKNQGELIDVLAEVRRCVPGASLTFVGDGVRLESVRRLAKTRGLLEAVEFCGLRQDVHSFLAAADVFVSTSTREGLPQAVLEAQAVGLPVVASELAAHREAVAPAMHALLFPLHNSEDAAGKVVALLRAPERRREIGEAGRRFIMERYDQAANMKRLLQWYAEWAAARPS